MGLLSGKTIISVASSVYNMAGEEKDRPIFLQNLVIRNVLSHTKKGMGETIPIGYLKGPGIKFRSFFRWALDNYDDIGVPTGQMYAGDAINTQMIEPYVPRNADQNVWVQDAFLGDSDFGYWAEQWMIANYPGELSSNWEAEFNDTTKQVKITRANGSVHTFIAADFIKGRKYIFAYVTKSLKTVYYPIVQGTLVSLAPGSPFPAMVGYVQDESVDTNRTETLTTTIVTENSYSDGRPVETSSSTSNNPVMVTRNRKRYYKDSYVSQGDNEDARVSRRDIRQQWTDKKKQASTNVTTTTTDIGGGVTRTTKTTTMTDYLIDDNSYRNDTQKIVDSTWLPMEMWIYRIGSGIPELDALLETVGDYGQFFPMIPFRLDNYFMEELTDRPDRATQLETARKAFRKAFDGAKYDDVLDELKDSEDIDDMDYIYSVFGVSLNTVDMSARRYIYEFLLRLQMNQKGGDDSAANLATAMAVYRTQFATWLNWKNGNQEGLEPAKPRRPGLPQNEIRIQADKIDYDIRLYWNFITEKFANGIGRPEAKKGDLWLEDRGEVVLEYPIYTSPTNSSGTVGVGSDNAYRYEVTRIYWQYEDNKYKYLDIAGFIHKNNVYKGNKVAITAKEALNDGDESGFLVPLHYGTFRAMRLVDSTQMATACTFLVINSYQKVKQKWWQKGFFKVLFIIAVVVISTIFTGGAGFGLLGAHIAVGTSLGLTGMTAAIIGAVANALAAMVLTTILSPLTEKLGILGSVLSAAITIMIGGGLNNIANGGQFFNITDFLKPENLLKLTNAVGDGYAASIQADIMDMQNELTQLQDTANAELKNIREQYIEQFGYGGGQIDPTMFVQNNTPVTAEVRDTFLTRTLMSGSDIAQMANDLLNDYVNLNQTLPNAFT